MCKVILKSIQNCRSYEPDKNLTFRCDLTLGLPDRMFQMVHLHMIEKNCIKLFRNSSSIVEVMVWKYLDGGHTHTWTHAHMHAHSPNCHCDDYVLLTATKLDNKKKILGHSNFKFFTDLKVNNLSYALAKRGLKHLNPRHHLNYGFFRSILSSI